MSKVRVHAASVVIPPASRVRVHSAQLTAAGTSRVRVHAASIVATSELIANAGPDQSVEGLEHFVLDGSASTGNTAWEWSQDPSTPTPPVTLTGADSRYASGTAPGVAGADTTLTFRLRVGDGTTWSGYDTTQLHVARHRTFRVTDPDLSPMLVRRLPTTVVHRPPTAVLGPDQTVQVGAPVTIGGTDVAPDGIIIGREFSRVSGPAQPALAGTGGLRTFTPPVPGTYVYAKRVWDDYGTPSPVAYVTITVVDVDAFLLGVTEPNGSNTGFAAHGIAEYQLSNYAGSLTNLKAGDVAQRLAITGNLDPFYSGGLLRDSLILMGPTPYPTKTEWPAIRGLHAGVTGVVAEFVTIRPNVQTVDTYGPTGGGYTTRRCDISGVVDGQHVNGLPGEVKPWRSEGDYIHDLVRYAVDPRQSNGPSHGDGIQSAGNLDFELVGTAVHGSNTSAVLLQQGLGTYVKALFDRAWLYGAADGGACLNITENGRGPINNLTLNGVRFGGKTTSLMPSTTFHAATTSITDCVDMNTGQPIRFYDPDLKAWL